jgi:hypothetical protein
MAARSTVHVTAFRSDAPARAGLKGSLPSFMEVVNMIALYDVASGIPGSAASREKQCFGKR